MAETIWKMDRKTAQYIISHINKQAQFPFEECPKCGADYIKELGHDCDNVIDLKAETITDNDTVEPLSN